MVAFWTTLEGLANIACFMWVIALAAGLVRPQILKKTERQDVVKLCSLGFLVSFLVLATAYSRLNGLT